MSEKPIVHPYIPNSEPAVLKSMLDALGMTSSEDIYKEIPDRLRFKGEMDIPKAILSEAKLQKHVEGILAKNENCKDNISFLGGGMWNRYVPAVCDTILGRDEFLTSYVGEAYSDHGKFQALFETSSMLCDLTGHDACNTPTYDWANAAAIALRMATRTAGKSKVLVAKNIGPGRNMVVENYLLPEIEIVNVEYDKETGMLDLADLKAKVADDVAALYFETPNFFGVAELEAKAICDLAKSAGVLIIVGCDPTSLGVMEAPAAYGADYVVGDLQPLGLHMSFGGGCGGFITTHDSKEFVAEYPSLLYGICETEVEGEYGFGEVFYERTSYASREKGKDFIGTCAAMHGIVAGVYMALMGPQGFRELGEGILQRAAYLKKRLAEVPGLKLKFDQPTFGDFIVSFDGTGKKVKDINKALLEESIFGGQDLTCIFPELGECALYSVTEMHDVEDLDCLVDALKKVLA
jgi:glycine dehydrogenase subunit 1